MKVYVQSEGCSANFSEGEQIKGIISANHELVDREKADVIVLNICTVKGDDRALKEIRRCASKRIVVAGCVTDTIIDAVREDERISIVNTKNIDRIEEALDKKVHFIDDKKIVKLGMPRKRDNNIIGIVQIASGCMDNCAYCSTKQTKGNLFSFPEEQIIDEVKQCVKDGCKEIWVTAQDTACYGFDKGTNLAELLKKILEIDGDFFVRVGMGNPRHIKKYMKELIKVIKHPKVFKFLHIPVQSGNEEMLKRMLRGHSVQDYIRLVDDLKKEIPDITISTDIIVGLPGETEAQFMDSVKFVEETGPDILNISRFIARPGTRAAEMEQVSGGISKERSRKLTEVFHRIALKQNKKWEGWEGEIIIDEKGKDGTSVGRNYAYKPVVVKGECELGMKVKVKVEKAHRFHLEAIK